MINKKISKPIKDKKILSCIDELTFVFLSYKAHTIFHAIDYLKNNEKSFLPVKKKIKTLLVMLDNLGGD